MRDETRSLAKIRCYGLLAAALLALSVAPAQALPVDLSLPVVAPTPSLLVPGSSIFVEVAVSGLTSGAAPSLTAVDLTIGFDDAALDFVSLSFISFGGVQSTNLSGQPCTLANLDASCDVLLDSSASPGAVTLAVASLVTPADVNANQPASGSIATIEFLAQAPGATSLAFTQIALSGTTSGTSQGTLAASASSTLLNVVPEPAPAWLLALSLVALGRGRRTH